MYVAREYAYLQLHPMAIFLRNADCDTIRLAASHTTRAPHAPCTLHTLHVRIPPDPTARTAHTACTSPLSYETFRKLVLIGAEVVGANAIESEPKIHAFVKRM